MQAGDKVQLTKQLQEVVECANCNHLMVNLDRNELAVGDLAALKKAKLRISNPETDKPICLNCEYETWGQRLNNWFESNDDDDDDTPFFPSSSPSLFGGGGFSSGGFGGFGGGSFSGGGASRGF